MCVIVTVWPPGESLWENDQCEDLSAVAAPCPAT